MKNIFSIILIFAAIANSPAANAQLCSSPTPLPYYEFFETVTPPALPPCTLSEGVNPGGVNASKWSTKTNFINTIISIDISNPDFRYQVWYYTPKFLLNSTKQYRLIYHFASSTNNINEAPDLYVYTGTCQTNTCMTNLIGGRTSVRNKIWKGDTIIFNPTVTGSYYIGFYHSDERLIEHAAQEIALDSMSLEEVLPLPVNMSQLKASLINNTVTLSWATYTETDNTGFDIQQSTDGRNFNTIAFEPTKAAGGNSVAVLYYSYPFPYASHAFYRLKQKDRNGNFVYSNITTTQQPASINNQGIRIVGQAANSISIAYTSQRSGTEIITIIDATGKQVIKQTQKVFTGNNSLQLDIAALSTGTYYITVPGSKPVAFVKL